MFMGGGGDRVPRAIELEIHRWADDDIRKENERESLFLNDVKSTYLDCWEAFNYKSQPVVAVVMMMAK